MDTRDNTAIMRNYFFEINACVIFQQFAQLLQFIQPHIFGCRLTPIKEVVKETGDGQGSRELIR